MEYVFRPLRLLHFITSSSSSSSRFCAVICWLLTGVHIPSGVRGIDQRLTQGRLSSWAAKQAHILWNDRHPIVMVRHILDVLYFLRLFYWASSIGVLYRSSRRRRSSLLAPSMGTPHAIKKSDLYYSTPAALRIPLCFCSHRSWLHRYREYLSSNVTLSLRLYSILPRSQLQNLPHAKTSTFKALQHLQTMHLEIRSVRCPPKLIISGWFWRHFVYTERAIALVWQHISIRKEYWHSQVIASS